MKFKLSFLGMAALAVAAAGAAWVWTENRPSNSAEVTFRIPAGEGLSTTAQRLAEAGLVRNPLLFRAFVQITQGDRGVPTGTFLIPAALSAYDTATYFKTAQPVQIRVTIPEGWTSTKIARLLEEKHVVPAKDFLAVVQHPEVLGAAGAGLTTLEGRLFPDTYLFPLEIPAREAVGIFLETFDRKTAAWPQYSAEERERRIILASIVEREYQEPSEAPLIASVFLNRLEHRIALGSCATIEYILTEIQGRPHPKRIFFVHTQIESPFNTYINKGLPPSPISNPGLTALKAAFEPAQSDYLYFVVADPARGTHQFSANFAQHEKAREAYLNSFVTKG